MVNTGLVPTTNQNADKGTSITSKEGQYSSVTIQSRQVSPSGEKAQTDGLSVIRSALENQGVSQSAQELILSSWRGGTQKQYRTYWNKWQCFACEQSVDPFKPTVNKVLDFLQQLYAQGLGYSGINTARSALSSIITTEGNVTIGKHPLVQRLVKGVFQCRPSLPRYQNTWDTNVVLHYLKTLPSLQEISLSEIQFAH